MSDSEWSLKVANGNVMALLFQDDISRKDKIELPPDALKDHSNSVLAASDLSLIDEEGNETAPSMWRYQRLPTTTFGRWVLGVR